MWDALRNLSGWQRSLVVGIAFWLLGLAVLQAWVWSLASSEQDVVMARWDHVSGIVGVAVGAVVYVVDKVRAGNLGPRDEIASAIERLALRTTAITRDMAAQRGLLEVEDRLPVRWRHSRSRVAADLSAVFRSEARFPPLPGLDPLRRDQIAAGGDRASLLRLYGTLPSGRILLVGPPGSGKSSAAILLMLDALAHRGMHRETVDAQPIVPIPVFYTLHGWNPEPGTSTTQSAVEFIARRLSEDHPGILTSKLATRLLQAGHISVILDGLDEIPDPLRPYAISALSEVPFRMVLMGRRDETIAASVMGPLRGGVALELTPLHVDDAIAYIARHLPSPAPADWSDVVNRLRYSPDSPIASAFVGPLLLSLARHAYTGMRGASGSVMDLDELASVEAIENHLLDRTIETAYAPRFNSNGGSRYTVGQATEILTYIASNLRSRGIRDFAWWDIPAWEGVHVSGPALAPNNPRQQFREMLRGGIRIACYVPLVLVAYCVIFLIFGESWRTSLITVGILAGSIVVTGIISGLVLVVSELFNRPWRLEDSFGHTGPGDIWRRERRQAAVGSLQRGAAGGFIGLAAGALFTGPAEDPTLRLTYGLLYGVMLALAVALSSRLKGVLSIRVSGVFLTVTVVVGVCLFAIGSSVVLFAGLSVVIEQTPVSPWVWISALVSLTFGWLVSGLATGPAAPHVALDAVSRKLSKTRMAPHPLMAFLVDAHDQGLLRSVGPLYQFRHATLQDRLARGRLTPFSWHIRR